MVYARASAALFERVATALSNLGLEDSRYQIMRNFLRPTRTIHGQYIVLRSLLNTLQT